MSHRFLTAFVFSAAGLFSLAASPVQAATDATEPAAAGLWRSFLEVYRKESLEPLTPEVLDEKARASLIATAGPRFRAWKPDHNPSFRTMVAEMNTSDESVTQFDRVEATLKDLLPKIDRYGHSRPPPTSPSSGTHSARTPADSTSHSKLHRTDGPCVSLWTTAPPHWPE